MRGAAELVTPMQQGERVGHGLQAERPVERGVAAADDQHVLAAKFVHLAHRVEDGLALERLDAGKRRPLGRERAAAGCHDHDLGEERGAGIGREPEPPIARALEAIDALAQMQLGTERLDLRQQPVGQLLARDDGERGDVVDRLFRIELGALPAGLLQDVDDVRLDVEQAELEHRKQADGPGADDHGVGLDGRLAGPIRWGLRPVHLQLPWSGVPFLRTGVAVERGRTPWPDLIVASLPFAQGV